MGFGVWRSWLARTAGGRKVAGSSPVTPTIFMQYMYGVPQRTKQPKGVRRTVRNTALAACLLSILLLSSGVAYVFLTGGDVPAVSKLPDAVGETPLLKPSKPGLNAPESAAVQSVTSPVAPDNDAMISVKTNAGSTCTIAVDYVGAPDTNTLGKQSSDDYGDVSWTWHVAKTAPTGNWPIWTTCLYHNRSAVVEAVLQISK